MTRAELIAFVRESNRIEGIEREPSVGEVEAYREFLRLEHVTIRDLSRLVSRLAPRARLRDRPGLDVKVGRYFPPQGSVQVGYDLQRLLNDVNLGNPTAFEVHLRYERLHPFTDGNGRSGRALWLWMHDGKAPLGFLHAFYYEALRHAEEKT